MKIKKNNLRNFSTKGKAPEVDKNDPNVVTFSFASEEPYERWFGVEILSMKDGAMDMQRLNDSAPLLFNHNRDLQLGKVLEAWIEGSKAFCKVRFSNSEFAQSKLRDLREEILVNVSLGYEIRDMEMISKTDDRGTWMVTNYLPYEISCVTIPADNTVGVGRSLDEEIEIDVKDKDDEEEIDEEGTSEGDEPSDESKPAEEAPDEKPKEKTIEVITINERTVSMEQNDKKVERERINQIRMLAREHGQEDLAQKFIDGEKTPGEFALELVKVLGGSVKTIKDQNIDFSTKEIGKYSITRALNALLTKSWDKAGFEYECHMALQKQLGRESTKGFFMPTNVRAAYVAGTAANGGNLVQTEVRGDQFIDALRNRSVALLAGASQLTGLQGNISLPRKNGRSAIYWVAENGDITESEATFDQVSFTPKTIGALSQYSRQLLAQSSISVDALIMDDLNKEVALGIDSAAFNGTGANGQPTGLRNMAGLSTVAIGANGGNIDMDYIIDMETKVAEYNADAATMSYISNAKIVGQLKKLKSTTGEYLWKTSEKPFRQGALAPINGYDMFRSNQLPGDLSKGTSNGNLSAVVFGDFSQLVIAQWGAGIEIEANPYGDGFKKGATEVRAMALVDVNVRQPKAFSIITDAK